MIFVVVVGILIVHGSPRFVEALWSVTTYDNSVCVLWLKMLSCGLQDSHVRSCGEQVATSHFTDEEAEGVCLMPWAVIWWLPFFFLLLLFPLSYFYFVFLTCLSRRNNTNHTNDCNSGSSGNNSNNNNNDNGIIIIRADLYLIAMYQAVS